MSEAVSILELEERDLEDVYRFRRAEAAETPDADAIARSVAQSRWYLFENPEATPSLPKGFVARDARGAVVGVKLCSPQRFRCGDAEYVLLLGGGYYVNQSFRGVGLRLMRAYLAADACAHFATTMNEVSGAIYERYGGYPIPDSDHEMLGVLRWPPLVEEVLARRLGAGAPVRWLARLAAIRPRALRGRHPGARLVELARAADVEALDLDVPPEHAQQITAARRPDFLRWRYFEGPDRARGLFLLHAGPGERALVGTRIVPRGHRGQVRALMVLDYWGRLAPQGIAVAASLLAERFGDEADMIVFRGQPAERRSALAAAGFVQRALPRAIGVCIDRARRLPTSAWYLVPADGDMAV